MKENRKAEQTESSGRRRGADGSAEGGEEERFRRFEVFLLICAACAVIRAGLHQCYGVEKLRCLIN